MENQLILSSPDLDDQDIQELTLELARVVNRETKITARIPEADARVGERGDPVSIGTLALSFLTSGAAVALFQVIQTFFERNKSLVVTLKGKDGQELAIRSQNLGPGEFDQYLDRLSRFWEVKNGT